MYDSPKYLIHAEFTTNGVVERSDVVGAVFGQTEGLLGKDLDLRTLQEEGKLGRIDVEVTTAGGRSTGDITIACGLDRVETAVLAAALESMERVGPSRADVEVTELEDLRTAKRREIVDRAVDLLAAFERTSLTTDDILEEVRQAVRVEEIASYEGLPAGPHVPESDALVVVEGRADVLTLLEYGVRNAIAVEGTDVPQAVADLTDERTTTAFLDGDRGGDLILKELAQVGDLDAVTWAPAGRSVEDLDRADTMDALRRKVPYDAVAGEPSPQEAFWAIVDEAATATASATDSEASTADARDAEGEAADPETTTASSVAERVASVAAGETGDASTEAGEVATSPPTEAATTGTEPAASGGETATANAPSTTTERQPSAADDEAPSPESGGAAAESAASSADASEPDAAASSEPTDAGSEASQAGSPDVGDAAPEADQAPATPVTLPGHVEAVVGGETGTVRLVDADFETVAEAPTDEAFATLEAAATTPTAVVIDGELSQRVLDVAAQRGVEQVVATGFADFVKRPTDVRLRLAEEF
jgi:DNA primase